MKARCFSFTTIFRIVFLALSIMLCITACGPGETPSATDVPTATPSASDSPAPTTGVICPGYAPEVKGKVSLLFHQAWTGIEKRSVENWVANFERSHPKVEVETEITLLSQDTIDAQIASNSIADVFFVKDSDVYKYAVTKDVLMPLDNYISAFEIDTSNVLPQALELGRVDGRTYVIMRDYSHVVLCYNKTLIEYLAIDLEDPVELDKKGEWTWDTFKNYCERLTVKEEGNTTVIGASMRFGDSPLWIPFAEGLGEKWYDSVDKKVSFASDDKVTAGIMEMADAIKSGNMVFNPNGTITSVPVTRDDLVDFNSLDLAAQVVFQDIRISEFEAKGQTYIDNDVEWDIVSFPALPKHKVGTSTSGFAVFNRNNNPDAAAALCLSLYTEEGQLAYHGQEGGSVPNIKNLRDQVFWRMPFEDKNHSEDGIYYDAFISHPEADTYGQVDCVVPKEIAEIITECMANIIPESVNGTMDINTALATMEQQANALWATMKE